MLKNLIRQIALPLCLALFFFIPARAENNSPNSSLHGNSWSFGQSVDRNNQLWEKGIDGAQINKNQKKNKSANKDAADTTASINQALNQAQNMRVKGKVGLSLERNSTEWTIAPEQKAARADENISRDRHHILRPFVGVQSGDDFSINFGPEIILKDEEHSAESASSDQPDSALGLGMKFKYDF